jgi:orotidine-5'-phosphate decarboxylase
MSSTHNPIVFPLDVPSIDDAREWVRRLSDEVGVFKVGLELFCAAGPEAVRAIADAGAAGVFLDAKLHDIPATVEGAAREACSAGVRMLTAHCQGGVEMLRAAVRGAGDDVCVLGVTRLTSLPASQDEVTQAALQALEAGCGGIVCSPREAAAVREAVGPKLQIVCPGVRPAGSDAGDQVRVMTPGDAIRAGADWLVIGRPIRNAADPLAAVRAIREEIASARGTQ